MLDHTHDASARSWVESANEDGADFPLQNLPLGVFSPGDAAQDGAAAAPRIGVAIGDQVLDLAQVLPLLHGLPTAAAAALQGTSLNALFALGRPALTSLRHALWHLLAADSDDRVQVLPALRRQAQVTMHLPCQIGDYTDFFASPNHARNTFALFRPGQTFLPNFAHLPIAYHGRASSIVTGGTPVRRPWGQVRLEPDALPQVGPTRKLDFEVELGFFIGCGNALGQPVRVGDAEGHLAGVCVLNDWSARDVQAFESQPLGPFQSKNFLSSVAPWVVTLDALAPFRVAAAASDAQATPVQAYLHDPLHAVASAFDIRLRTSVQTQAMRTRGERAQPVSHARFARDVCWTPAQMLAHHTLGGCNLRPGDLLGSGTISGPAAGTEGSLLELTSNGRYPLALAHGETRSFLEDGDEVTLTAWCEREGFRRVGLGSCSTQVLPAIPAPF